MIDDTDGIAAVQTAVAAGDGADRATLALAVRYTTQVLVQRAPGASVEVRVPPFAAVQCVAGGAHTRGTPRAVVEVDPQTWLALATGLAAWGDAVASGAVRASGERSDVSVYLPLVAVPA